MDYLPLLDRLKLARTNEVLVNTVNSSVRECLAKQSLDNTNRYRAFMLTNQAELNVRLQGLVDFLARGKPKPKKDPNELGVVAGYRVHDNRKMIVDHLILGIPNTFAIMLVTKIDLTVNKVTLESAYGVFLNDQLIPQTKPPTNRITRTATIEKTKELLGWLTKLGLAEPIHQPVVDPTKTMEHVQKTYEENWGGDTKPMKAQAN